MHNGQFLPDWPGEAAPSVNIDASFRVDAVLAPLRRLKRAGRMLISVIIPVYKEAGKIAGDIKAAAEFLADKRLEAEIIVVDDGGKDGTAEAAEKTVPELGPGIGLKVIRNKEHRGKGYAIRTGVAQSTGDYVMFADSGLCVPYDNVLRGLDMLENGECELAHGSRRLKGTHILRDQGLYRHICSRFFHWFMILFMGIPARLTDTQCGFKIYKGDIARRLYGQCITDGFMFDVEITLRALKQSCRIREFAIDWACDRDSRLSPTRNARRMLSELMAIRRRLRD